MIRLVTTSEPLLDCSRLTARDRVRLFLRLQRFARPVWDKLLLRMLASQVMALLAVVPVAMGIRLIDEALVGRDAVVLLECVVVLLAVRLLDRVFAFIHDVMAGYGAARITLDLSTVFYRHLQRLSLRQFHARPVGEHMFRCTADVADCTYLANDAIPAAVYCLQRATALTLMLGVLGTWLIWPALVYLIVSFAGRHWISTGYRRWDRQARHEGQQCQSVLREILSAFRLVESYDRRATARRWFGGQLFRMLRAGWRRALFLTGDSIFASTMDGVAIIGLNAVTGLYVIRGTMTLGEFAAVAGVVLGLIRPVQDVIGVFQSVRQRLVPAERLLETLDLVPDIGDPPDPVLPEIPRGRIELCAVSFAYDDTPVLKEVSLVAEAGDKVAIVGPNGAGKSTLTRLLLRLYEPTSGRILLDGVDLRRYPQQRLRERIGLVMQEHHVFDESLRANIAYGRRGASDAELRRACALAGVDGVVASLPHGYDTPLGEGNTISGGQRQRVSLARGLVREPQVLVLDETTSALDPVTEARVVANIDAAYAGRTRIVIAHNLLNACTADRIYVLDHGRVVETGTHDQLMAQKGVYCRLWTEPPIRPQAEASAGRMSSIASSGV